MPEIVGTFARVETRDEGANSAMQSWDSAGGDLAQVSLEFAEGHLDRVKVGGILRQIAKGCSPGLDRLADAGDFVGSKIIDHHDVVSLQRWHETMFKLAMGGLQRLERLGLAQARAGPVDGWPRC